MPAGVDRLHATDRPIILNVSRRCVRTASVSPPARSRGARPLSVHTAADDAVGALYRRDERIPVD